MNGLVLCTLLLSAQLWLVSVFGTAMDSVEGMLGQSDRRPQVWSVYFVMLIQIGGRNFRSVSVERERLVGIGSKTKSVLYTVCSMEGTGAILAYCLRRKQRIAHARRGDKYKAF